MPTSFIRTKILWMNSAVYLPYNNVFALDIIHRQFSLNKYIEFADLTDYHTSAICYSQNIFPQLLVWWTFSSSTFKHVTRLLFPGVSFIYYLSKVLFIEIASFSGTTALWNSLVLPCFHLVYIQLFKLSVNHIFWI